MARNIEHNYPVLKADTLKDPVIFVVDMVNGFIFEGALHDEAIHDITPNIQSLMESLECRNVFVCDSHPPKTREFDAYPAHCVIGTSEAEVIDDLRPYIKWMIHKNSTNTFTAPEFQSFLEQEMNRYRDIIITGCCTDLCILQFALSLQAWLNEHNKTKMRIIVPADCVETYHIEGVHDAGYWNDVALENMRINGIDVVSKIME